MLYAIAGGGEAPANEITKVLTDLRSKATKDEVDFWFLVEGKDEPTKTDNDILKWLAKNETYFEVYTATGTTYDRAAETTQADDVFESMLERLQEAQTDEEIMVLALLPAEDAEDDEALMALIGAANAADVEVRQLNGAMETLTLGDAETEAATEAEPEPAPAPAKKAAAKKAAPVKKTASKRAAAPAAAAAEEEIPGGVYTQEELTKLGIPELTGIAKGQGLDTKGLGKRDLITAILGSTRMAEADEAVAAATSAEGNGEVPGDDEVVLVVIHTPGTIIQRVLSMKEVAPLLR
jgi:hypothetical protein